MNRVFLFTAAFVTALCSCRTTSVSRQGWTVDMGHGITITHNHDTIAHGIHAEFAYHGHIIRPSNYVERKMTKYEDSDMLGSHTRVCVTYKSDTLPSMHHTFRLYENFLLAEAVIESNGNLSTNYIAPLVTEHTGDMICNAAHRKTFVPFDNDKWIRYGSMLDSGDTLRSYEVTGIYNPVTRRGVVIGAVTHDKWKNAIDITAHGGALKAFSGVADRLTRDSRSHGMLKGTTVSSATMMVGVFDDWRDGMECYARLNAMHAPPRKWSGTVPVGWNSWGALQFGINPKNTGEVVEFIADSLASGGFASADGTVYTGLDSGWDSFGEQRLKEFAEHCSKRGQTPCIYWTPFTDWAKNPEREVPNGGGYRYKDIYLYADGHTMELDGALAIDPTHPAVKSMMEHTAALFRRCGYKYVKMDFMTHGRMEADSWHNPDVSTGTEAYNYGMHLLDSIFHDMYINLSISPVFPAQYAQSRRIACDAWNKIKDTEYTMNALSWGWWTDKVYSFNDADHVVLRDATPGENRARITSAVVTGMVIAGDDFSHGGDATAKRRAVRLLTNKRVNSLVDGRSFRPLDADSDRSEHMFVRTESDGSVCLAVFNYTDSPVSFRLPERRLALKDATDYQVTELWSGSTVNRSHTICIPPKDAMIFMFAAVPGESAFRQTCKP